MAEDSAGDALVQHHVRERHGTRRHAEPNIAARRLGGQRRDRQGGRLAEQIVRSVLGAKEAARDILCWHGWNGVGLRHCFPVSAPRVPRASSRALKLINALFFTSGFNLENRVCASKSPPLFYGRVNIECLLNNTPLLCHRSPTAHTQGVRAVLCTVERRDILCPSPLAPAYPDLLYNPTARPYSAAVSFPRLLTRTLRWLLETRARLRFHALLKTRRRRAIEMGGC